MAVNVYPGASNPSHHLSLSDGVQTWGLSLDGGEEALREAPLTPSTLSFRDGVSSFGEWEPGMASIEQRSWHGGRGLDVFSAEDPAAAIRFYDSMNAWTLTPGYLLPAPQWQLARGLRAGIQRLPGDVQWLGLFGEQRWLSRSFTVGPDDFPVAEASLWLRRVGRPGLLSLHLATDDGGQPGAVVAGSLVSITAKDLADVISEFRRFDLSAVSADLSAATTYHVVVSGAGEDNAANHWEAGVEAGALGAFRSGDGSGWVAESAGLYYRLADAPTRRTFHFFKMDGAFYAVDQRADGHPSRLYMNGARGVATDGGPTTLVDGNQAWEADQWAGAWVRISSGMGAGQARPITSNTATELSVAAWDIEPDSTSQYIVYATQQWADISPTSGDLIDGVVSDVAVLHDQALFAQGEGVNILRMRFNAGATPPAHEFDDDGSNKADLLHSFHHPEHGPQVWRARLAAGELSRAGAAAWGSAMAYGSAVKVGSSHQPIQAVFDMAGSPWALKADGLWRIDTDDQAEGFGPQLPPHNHAPGALAMYAGDLHFGWGPSLLRYADGTLTDIGPAAGAGLPPGRGGAIRALQPLGAWLAAGVDAGESGWSSLLLGREGAWHEVYRAPQPGQRLTALAVQECPGARPRLWAAVGGDLVCIELPATGENPLGDQGLAYQHEAVLEAATVDMGAMRLPKFLKELSLVSQGLLTGLEVHLDYQLDGDIGGGEWRSAGAFYSSSLDSVALNVGQVRAIRTRLRLLSTRARQPARVRGTLLEGFARTPLKYQWILRVRLADLALDRGGGIQPDPEAFMEWLKGAAREARKIRVRSIWPALDDAYVIVKPPNLRRQFSNSLLGWWGGSVQLTLREV